jgi:hypothetical protein
METAETYREIERLTGLLAEACVCEAEGCRKFLAKTVGELAALLPPAPGAPVLEKVWGVRYGVAKTMDSDAEPSEYTTERENEQDARAWRDENAPHGEVGYHLLGSWVSTDAESGA